MHCFSWLVDLSSAVFVDLPVTIALRYTVEGAEEAREYRYALRDTVDAKQVRRWRGYGSRGRGLDRKRD